MNSSSVLSNILNNADFTDHFRFLADKAKSITVGEDGIFGVTVLKIIYHDDEVAIVPVDLDNDIYSTLERINFDLQPKRGQAASKFHV